MQINSANLQKFCEWYRHGAPFNSFNAWDSMDVGLAHLRWLFEKYGDWQEAVCAYNAGESAVERNRIPATTIAYARRVLGYRFKGSATVKMEAQNSLTYKGSHDMME